MSGKVVHLDSTIHHRAKEFCEKNGISIGNWVEKLVINAITRSDHNIVEKTKLDDLDMGKEDNLWSKPPFWNSDDNTRP